MAGIQDNMSSDLTSLSDESLVKLYRDGTGEAFDELYARYAVKLKRLIYHYLSDPEDADDVFHEVFLRVFRHLHTYREDRLFGSWIYQIAVNCSKNFKRKNVRNDIIVEKEKRLFSNEEDKFSPEKMMIRDSELNEFYRAVDELKSNFRTVFLLRFDQKMKYSEISEILDCSERTAKWRMKKALEHIADHLKKEGII